MTEVAYTIGRMSSYDASLADANAGLLDHPVMKIGRDHKNYSFLEEAANSLYPGGWVFRNVKDACGFMLTPAFTHWFGDTDEALMSFAVYELELPTSWEVDTYTIDGVRCLINDARIVKNVLAGTIAR